MRVALTGGIGSGKSSVASRLAELGAVVVDADAIAREVVEPGTPGLAAVVQEFGSGVLAADGSLDRAELASIVFSDAQRRQALEAIVHPLVGLRSAELLAAAAPDAVVVYDVPLLAESLGTGRDRSGEFDAIVVVEAPEDLRVARLVARGLTEPDARARIAAQSTDAQRREISDHILDNSGDLAHLTTQVDALWTILTAPDASRSPGGEHPGR